MTSLLVRLVTFPARLVLHELHLYRQVTRSKSRRQGYVHQPKHLGPRR